METKTLIMGLILIALFSGCTGTEKQEEATTTLATTSIAATTLPATSTTTLKAATTTTSTTSLTTTIKDTDGSKRLLWEYTTEGIVNKVAITPDGRYVLVGADKGHLYLLDNKGSLRWKKKAGEGVLDFSITSDGRYAVAGFGSAKNDNPLYLIDRDGHIKHEYEYSIRKDKYRVDGSNAYITPDGEYVLGGYRRVCLLRRNGTPVWKYYIGSKSGEVASGLFTSDDAALSVIWSGSRIYVINKKGCVTRELKTDGIIFSASLSEDLSLIAAGDRDNNVYLFKNDTLLWKYEVGDWVRSVKIAPYGKYIVAGSKDSNVYLFNHDGELLWSYRIKWDVLDVDVSRYLVAGGKDKTIYLLGKGSNLIWKFKSDSEIKDVEITPDGRYVVAGAGDKVYLFKTSIWE